MNGKRRKLRLMVVTLRLSLIVLMLVVVIMLSSFMIVNRMFYKYMVNNFKRFYLA